MNSITTRVWIAGASGRLGSALSHRFGGNTAYKLVTSDRDVAVEDVSVVGRFAGSEALAAVGSNGAVINLLVTLFSGISLGSNVIIAGYIGEGNQQKIYACAS